MSEMNNTTEEKTCSKVRVKTGVRVICEPPSYATRWISAPYGTEKYWDRVGEILGDWAKEINEFIRDHRSRDDVGLSVEFDFEEQCTACQQPWELDSSYDDGKPRCSYCGAIYVKESA